MKFTSAQLRLLSEAGMDYDDPEDGKPILKLDFGKGYLFKREGNNLGHKILNPGKPGPLKTNVKENSRIFNKIFKDFLAGK